jgi:hypothetical protein
MIDFVRALQASRDFGSDLVEVRSFPPAPGRFGELTPGLPASLLAALNRLGIERL